MTCLTCVNRAYGGGWQPDFCRKDGRFLPDDGAEPCGEHEPRPSPLDPFVRLFGRRVVAMTDDGDRVVMREAFGRQVVVSVEEDCDAC